MTEWNAGFERAALENAVAIWQVLSEMALLCQAQSEEKELFKASSDTEIIGKPPRANWKSNSCLHAAGFHCFNIGPTIPNNTCTGNSGEKYVGKQLRGQLKIKVNELDVSMLLCVLFCYFFSCQLLFLNLYLLFLFLKPFPLSWTCILTAICSGKCWIW